jgi:hypothetical protein
LFRKAPGLYLWPNATSGDLNVYKGRFRRPPKGHPRLKPNSVLTPSFAIVTHYHPDYADVLVPLTLAQAIGYLAVVLLSLVPPDDYAAPAGKNKKKLGHYQPINPSRGEWSLKTATDRWREEQMEKRPRRKRLAVSRGRTITRQDVEQAAPEATVTSTPSGGHEYRLPPDAPEEAVKGAQRAVNDLIRRNATPAALAAKASCSPRPSGP